MRNAVNKLNINTHVHLNQKHAFLPQMLTLLLLSFLVFEISLLFWNFSKFEFQSKTAHCCTLSLTPGNQETVREVLQIKGGKEGKSQTYAQFDICFRFSCCFVVVLLLLGCCCFLFVHKFNMCWYWTDKTKKPLLASSHRREDQRQMKTVFRAGRRGGKGTAKWHLGQHKRAGVDSLDNPQHTKLVWVG